MKIFDAHCDVLGKLWQYPQIDYYQGDKQLHVGFPDLEKGNVDIQVLACFVPTHVPFGRRFHTVLEMIDVFYERVASEQFRMITTKADLQDCVLKGRKGAILFVEGAHALEESLVQLRTWYRLGVRGMTLTWNHGNAVADGSGEPNPGGVTAFGRQVVAEMNRLGMIIDVSHLADPGFWDIMELSQAPVIASHSNSRQLCNHPRNLTDEQIKALIAKDGVMGLTFVDFFTIEEKRKVWIDDILRHLDHVCALGGVDHVAFGSDFDGISQTYGDLTCAGDYPLLLEALLKRYKEEEVMKFVQGNWLRVFGNVLQ
ncbi:membrane dipeptidase [Brevibacillus nitrificans]|uniref:Membrane dipeptidase n=1 Tax=Brevibacillus nitrificans TaxID=651560 RepID=A0A3M8DJI3_9BACL|nr:dipeptidase [Brevibacillus nitrificans]RNB88188.1 membrane dipeptidase [Brevibacillus nitrificans]